MKKGSLSENCRMGWNNFKARLKNQHFDKRAFMVEMLLALVVFGTIAYAAYNQYDKGRMKTSITNTKNTVTLLRTGIQGIYRGQEYEVPTPEVLKASNVMNKEQWRGTEAFNEWSGKIIVGSDSPESFSIQLTLLPQEACMAMAQNGNDWLSVDINGTKKETVELPYPAGAAATACKPTSDNDVTFVSN